VFDERKEVGKMTDDDTGTTVAGFVSTYLFTDGKEKINV
jgi:hypothetical protein